MPKRFFTKTELHWEVHWDFEKVHWDFGSHYKIRIFFSQKGPNKAKNGEKRFKTYFLLKLTETSKLFPDTNGHEKCPFAGKSPLGYFVYLGDKVFNFGF